MRSFGLRRVGIHPHDGDIVRKKRFELVFDTLRPDTELCKIARSAVRAARCRVGIGLDGPAPAAAVAHERMRPLVVGKRRRAVRTLRHTAALAAHEEVRKAAAIQKKDCLLLLLCNLIERLLERLREDRLVSVRELACHIDDLDSRKLCCARALRHLDPCPLGSAEASFPAAPQALERRRGRAQDERRSPSLRKLCGDLAGMVARSRILLVGSLVLLVDDEKAQIMDWGEER